MFDQGAGADSERDKCLGHPGFGMDGAHMLHLSGYYYDYYYYYYDYEYY